MTLSERLAELEAGVQRDRDPATRETPWHKDALSEQRFAEFAEAFIGPAVNALLVLCKQHLADCTCEGCTLILAIGTSDLL